MHHVKTLTTKYSHLQKSCCDPFSLHGSSAVHGNSLRVISEEMANFLCSKGKKVHPDQKLCVNCNLRASDLAEESEENEDDAEVAMDTRSVSREESDVTKAVRADILQPVNAALEAQQFSPIKPVVRTRDQRHYVKRKVTEASRAVFAQLETFFNEKDLCDPDIPSDKPCQNCEDLNHLMNELKEKLTQSDTTKEKIKILTLAPKSWTIEDTAQHFGVSKYRQTTRCSCQPAADCL
jgi:hypothetical protein